MIFTETAIAGAYLVELERLSDARGFFARAWSSEEFGRMGLETTFATINLSSSVRKGTIRGMHFQRPPHAEAKFVRCIKGALFDVMIDLRPDSPTFHRWAGFEIRASEYQAVYVPAGCAHGVQTLEDDTEMLYMTSAPFHAEAEGGIRWDDPFFGVAWPECGERTISEKDQSWPDYDPAKFITQNQDHDYR